MLNFLVFIKLYHKWITLGVCKFRKLSFRTDLIFNCTPNIHLSTAHEVRLVAHEREHWWPGRAAGARPRGVGGRRRLRVERGEQRVGERKRRTRAHRVDHQIGVRCEHLELFVLTSSVMEMIDDTHSHTN